ncbi:MAG: patatin-like phospholipase family protein [Minisyncoccia bacterium]
MENKRKTVGLILGSGADRGMAHIGIIKTLQKYNIPIDYISGSSIGAVVGAYYALYLEVDGLEKTIKAVMKSNLFKLFDFNFFKPSLIKGRKFYDLMKYNLYGDKIFDDTQIPLRINATNLDTGNSYIFTNGRILDAVIPSMTIPGILPIVVNNDVNLIDGGLSDAIPSHILDEFHPDVIIAVDLYSSKMEKIEKYNLRSLLNRIYQIYTTRLSGLSIKELKNSGANCIILNPQTNETFESLTFKNIEKNIKIGMEETESKIEEIKRLLN